MNQGTLFQCDESPVAGAPTPAPAPTPGTKPERHRRDPELEALVKRRTREILVAHAPMLATLRHAASRYFHARSDGKVYRRDPALKITIVAPAAEGAPAAKVMIYPGVSRRDIEDTRQVTVEAGWIRLTLCHLVPHEGKVEYRERITLVLDSNGEVRTGRYFPRTSDVDAERTCTTAARFLEDPPAAVAASGTHCSFCGRALTDPDSRARGIGPECFGHYGDFLRYISPAPAGDPPPSPAEVAPAKP